MKISDRYDKTDTSVILVLIMWHVEAEGGWKYLGSGQV